MILEMHKIGNIIVKNIVLRSKVEGMTYARRTTMEYNQSSKNADDTNSKIIKFDVRDQLVKRKKGANRVRIRKCNSLSKRFWKT
jgi:hypothetical protein